VHALVSLPPNLEMSRFVNTVKTTTMADSARLRPGASRRVSQAGVPVAIAIASSRAVLTADDDQAIFEQQSEPD